jgi:hypothetical protein
MKAILMAIAVNTIIQATIRAIHYILVLFDYFIFSFSILSLRMTVGGRVEGTVGYY